MVVRTAEKVLARGDRAQWPQEVQGSILRRSKGADSVSEEAKEALPLNRIPAGEPPVLQREDNQCYLRFLLAASAACFSSRLAWSSNSLALAACPSMSHSLAC